ncbi:MAG TPA: polyprenyl diphosphate synthase, partial [Patescibacteria group bacterium]|nr:polyprenyl diphosphate synthase [Patescibacteria group bacterium]
EGHRRGYQKAKQVGDWCLERGIQILTVYAFSTENWKRSKVEVNFLMNILEEALTKDLAEFIDKGIRLRIIGDSLGLSQKLQQVIDIAQQKTKDNKKGDLNIAVNYGGRLEIVEAVKKITRKKISPVKINEQLIADNLWTAGQPDPDLIIRTSGEQRLSGFLTWQSVYSELYFTPKHWPDFIENDLDKAIDNFQKRDRRFGGK